MGSPKGLSSKEKAEAEAIRVEQKTQIAELDEEENRRIKKLLSANRGTRSYRGGPMFRGRPSDTAGAAPRAAAGAGSAAPGAGAMRSGGRAGGLNRPGLHSLLMN